MKVFISWSGANSHEVALVLRKWLPPVLQHVDTWVSSEDIPKGAMWIDRLGTALAGADFGIVCLVPGNLDASWINFEAGVMAREIETARLSSLLVGLGHSDVQGHPLGQFQNTVVDEGDVRKLVHSINEASPNQIAGDRLDAAFDMGWPTLEEHLNKLARASSVPSEPAAKPAAEPARSSDDLPKEMAEVLALLDKNEGLRISIEAISSHIGETSERTKYFIGELRHLRLIHSPVISSAGNSYSLTHAGRKYLFDHGLI